MLGRRRSTEYAEGFRRGRASGSPRMASPPPRDCGGDQWRRTVPVRVLARTSISSPTSGTLRAGELPPSSRMASPDRSSSAVAHRLAGRSRIDASRLPGSRLRLRASPVTSHLSRRRRDAAPAEHRPVGTSWSRAFDSRGGEHVASAPRAARSILDAGGQGVDLRSATIVPLRTLARSLVRRRAQRRPRAAAFEFDVCRSGRRLRSARRRAVTDGAARVRQRRPRTSGVHRLRRTARAGARARRPPDAAPRRGRRPRRR